MTEKITMTNEADDTSVWTVDGVPFRVDTWEALYEEDGTMVLTVAPSFPNWDGFRLVSNVVVAGETIGATVFPSVSSSEGRLVAHPGVIATDLDTVGVGEVCRMAYWRLDVPRDVAP